MRLSSGPAGNGAGGFKTQGAGDEEDRGDAPDEGSPELAEGAQCGGNDEPGEAKADQGKAEPAARPLRPFGKVRQGDPGGELQQHGIGAQEIGRLADQPSKQHNRGQGADNHSRSVASGRQERAGKHTIEQRLIVQAPAGRKQREGQAPGIKVRNEGQRERQMRPGGVDIGQERRPDHAEGGDEKGRQPVERRHAREATPEEDGRPRLKNGGDPPHDNAADHEEDVDAGTSNLKAAAAPLTRMVSDDRHDGERAKILDGVQRLHGRAGRTASSAA